MPRAKLTKTVVDKAKHQGKGNQTFYRDTQLQGFALRVTAAGSKSYVVEYRHGDGRSRRVTLGKHGALTADGAREMAQATLGDAAKARLNLGDDPAEVRRREREGDTFDDVAGRYLEDLLARAKAGDARRSGWATARDLWRRHVPGDLKRRKVDEVTTAHIQKAVRGRKLASKQATANHVLTVMHAALQHAITERLIKDNPAKVVKRYTRKTEQRRKPRRALSLDELARLGKVLKAVEETGKVTVADDDGDATTYAVDPAAALTLRLLVLTGMRKSELLGHHTKARRGPREGLRWSDLDLEARRYTLTASGGGSGAKGGDERELPLGQAAVDVLRTIKPADARPEGLVVPSPRDPAKPYNGLNKARTRIYAAAGIEGRDTHSLRHTHETTVFKVDPEYAGVTTGRAVTRDSILNDYIDGKDKDIVARVHLVADAVAEILAAAMAGKLDAAAKMLAAAMAGKLTAEMLAATPAGELADVVPFEQRREGAR